jgi:4'-phosphopantetheinyl transferase
MRFFCDRAIDEQPERWKFWQWRPSMDSLAALCVENVPGVEHTIHVRRAASFRQAEDIAFDATRFGPLPV